MIPQSLLFALLRPPLRLAGCVWFSLALAGCGNRIGPRAVEASFPHYGDAVHTVIHEDLLLNLVRRRHQEAPQFVTLGSITQTRSVSSNVTLRSTFDSLGFLLADGEAGASRTDYPTFSIVPQQGPDFAEKLHERIPLKILPHLTNAGYPVELVFMLLAQEVAGVPGVYVSTSDSFRPGSPQFTEMLNAMKALEDRNQLKVENVKWEEPSFPHPFAPEVFSPADIVKTGDNGKQYASLDGGQTFYVTSENLRPAMWISPEARLTGPARQLLGILRVEPESSRKAWPLEEVSYLGGKDAASQDSSVTVRTRSFYGVLNLLAQGVRLPGSGDQVQIVDEGYGKAVAAGLAPDIARRFVVHFSQARPRGAFVTVKTHGGWFWIAEEDHSSKEIFNALFDLFQLQLPTGMSEAATAATPVLSISTP